MGKEQRESNFGAPVTLQEIERTEREMLDILNITDAKKYIVESARKIVVGWDWEHFGVEKEQVGKYFDAVFPIMLRNAGMDFALNVIREQDRAERSYLEMIPENCKEQFENSGFWLVLIRPLRSPDALYIHDHLVLKAPEVLPILFGLDSSKVIEYLTGKHFTELAEVAFRHEKGFAGRIVDVMI